MGYLGGAGAFLLYLAVRFRHCPLIKQYCMKQKKEVLEMVERAEGMFAIVLDITDREKRMARTGFVCDFPKDCSMWHIVDQLMMYSPEAKRSLIELMRIVVTVLAERDPQEYLELVKTLNGTLAPDKEKSDNKIAN